MYLKWRSQKCILFIVWDAEPYGDPKQLFVYLKWLFENDSFFVLKCIYHSEKERIIICAWNLSALYVWTDLLLHLKWHASFVYLFVYLKWHSKLVYFFVYLKMTCYFCVFCVAKMTCCWEGNIFLFVYVEKLLLEVQIYLCT